MFIPSHFPTQKKDEEVKIFLRRHWVSFIPVLLILLFLLALPLVAFLIIRLANLDLGNLRSLVYLGGSAYLLTVLAFFLIAFVDFYLDVGIITNERIVDIQQKGLFNRDIAEQNLIRVQDVSSKKKGVIPTFFDYGELFVQTAGEAPNFIFYAIPHPYEIAQKILQLHAQAIEDHEKELGLEVGGEYHPTHHTHPKPQPAPEAKDETDNLKEIPKIE